MRPARNEAPKVRTRPFRRSSGELPWAGVIEITAMLRLRSRAPSRVPLVLAAAFWLVGCCVAGTESDAKERDAALAAFVLSSLPADASPLDVRFGDRGEVQLIGVRLERAAITPGDPLTATFFWRVDARVVGGWSVFTHVLDDRGERVANGDHAGPLRAPAHGAQRLGPSLWKPGHVYADEITVALPPNVREGQLRFAVGIFRGQDRLPARGVGVDGENRAIVAAAKLGPSPEQIAREQLPSLVVPRRGGPPLVIDGRLDDAAWQSAARTRPFVEPGTGRESPTSDPRGSARFLWDDEALYVGFTVASTRLEGRFPKDARDAHLWEHECVELMIDPDGDGDNLDYYEVQISPQNLVFDSRFDAYNQPRGGPEGPFGHQDWSCGGRTAVVVDGTLDDDTDTDRGYTVEVSIPFARFDRAQRVPPREGDAWRVNAYVMKHNGGLAWSPILGQGNFHRASRFGRLVFGPAP